MTESSDLRRSLLVDTHDAIPAGAFFVEARFSAPEGEWTPLIQGAALATLDNGVLAAPPGPQYGRFPLPSQEAVDAALTSWGADGDTPIVVYATVPDDAKSAARAWFVLRNAGVVDVRILNGGIDGWRAREAASFGTALGSLASGEPQATAPAAPAAEFAVRAVDAARAREVGASGTLLDARPASAHSDGRVPGAVSAPGSDVFRDGYLLAEEELRTWAEALVPEGEQSLAAYCGGGVAAAGTVFALATLGINAELYVGSWSQWSRDENNPIER